jgi:hypothetical protein
VLGNSRKPWGFFGKIDMGKFCRILRVFRDRDFFEVFLGFLGILKRVFLGFGQFYDFWVFLKNADF